MAFYFGYVDFMNYVAHTIPINAIGGGLSLVKREKNVLHLVKRHQSLMDTHFDGHVMQTVAVHAA